MPPAIGAMMPWMIGRRISVRNMLYSVSAKFLAKSLPDSKPRSSASVRLLEIEPTVRSHSAAKSAIAFFACSPAANVSLAAAAARIRASRSRYSSELLSSFEFSSWSSAMDSSRCVLLRPSMPVSRSSSRTIARTDSLLRSTCSS